MLYYSKELDKFFNTEKECADAISKFNEEQKRHEAEKKQKNAQRAERAKAVEQARSEMVEAQKKYHDLLAKFIEDYGSFHMTTSSADELPLCLSWFGLL